MCDGRVCVCVVLCVVLCFGVFLFFSRFNRDKNTSHGLTAHGSWAHKTHGKASGQCQPSDVFRNAVRLVSCEPSQLWSLRRVKMAICAVHVGLLSGHGDVAYSPR